MAKKKARQAIAKSRRGTSGELSIAGVSERDIDLMLLEEFIASRQFQRWFATEFSGRSARPGKLVSAQRSVTQTSGESDLEVTFVDAAGLDTRYLIENKVRAGLQREQAERYRRRGEDYLARKECEAFHTVLMAPSRYFGKEVLTKGFDKAISYERLRKWFAGAKHLGDRRRYKLRLLDSAIQKGALGYQLEEDMSVTNFWKDYWEFACRQAQELSMKKPSGKPSRSSFIYFRPGTLPKGIEICHKFAHGFVDLQVNKFGGRVNELHRALYPLLPEGAEIQRAKQSAVIRIVVPRLSPARPFTEQLADARTGLQTAQLLHRWYLETARATFEGLRNSHSGDQGLKNRSTHGW